MTAFAAVGASFAFKISTYLVIFSRVGTGGF